MRAYPIVVVPIGDASMRCAGSHGQQSEGRTAHLREFNGDEVLCVSQLSCDHASCALGTPLFQSKSEGQESCTSVGLVRPETCAVRQRCGRQVRGRTFAKGRRTYCTLLPSSSGTNGTNNVVHVFVSAVSRTLIWTHIRRPIHLQSTCNI